MQSEWDARSTLRELERVRHDTRRALHPTWYDNLVAGTFFLGATAASAFGGTSSLAAVYWAVGVPLGLGLIVRHALRRERALGAEAPAADPGVLVVLAMLAGVVAVNLLTEDTVLWAYPVALGWLALAAVYRDPPMSAAGVALAVVATAMLALDPAHAGLWTQLALALLLLAAGLASRARERA